MKKSKIYHILKTLIQITIATIVIYITFKHLIKEIKNLDLEKIKYIMINLGFSKFFLVIVLGLLGMSILSMYDFIVLKSIPMSNKLKKIKIFRVSFMTNSFNMILGFGGFIGAWFRYYLYKPYSKDYKKLPLAIGMILISMLSGISMLSILVLIGIFPANDIYLTNKYIYYSLFIIAIFFPLYIFFDIKKSSKFLSLKLAIISFLEWLYAALLILFVLYLLESNVVAGKEMRIIGVIIVSAIAGLLSMIPGGVGVFDYLLLTGLIGLGFSAEVLATTIILYRLAYYIIPFFISLLLLVVELIEVVKLKYKKGGNLF